VTLDLACLAVLVLAAVGGAFAGAIPQLVHVGAVVAGWAGARAIGPRIAPLLQGKVPAFAAHPIASVAAFIGCTILATLAARALLVLTPLRGAPGSRADRGIGALLAGIQAALVLWVGLSALAVWNRPVRVGRVEVDPAGSELVGLARECNALGPLASPRAEH
jgi:uncharacterized membrane protein required for colicin V production